jgi:hypothetical protein
MTGAKVSNSKHHGAVRAENHVQVWDGQTKRMTGQEAANVQHEFAA